MATQAKRDYYEVLAVTRTATEQEIRNAFERLLSEFKAAGKPRNIDDLEEIRMIATAYRVLPNAEKRSCYDKFGHCPPGETVLTADDWSKKEAARESPASTEGLAEAMTIILSGS